jgi:hypothetical protein
LAVCQRDGDFFGRHTEDHTMIQANDERCAFRFRMAR